MNTTYFTLRLQQGTSLLDLSTSEIEQASALAVRDFEVYRRAGLAVDQALERVEEDLFLPYKIRLDATSRLLEILQDDFPAESYLQDKPHLQYLAKTFSHNLSHELTVLVRAFIIAEIKTYSTHNRPSNGL